MGSLPHGLGSDVADIHRHMWHESKRQRVSQLILVQSHQLSRAHRRTDAMVRRIPTTGIVIALAGVSDGSYDFIGYDHGGHHLRAGRVERFADRQDSGEHLVVVRDTIEIGVPYHEAIGKGSHLRGGLYTVAQNRTRARHGLGQPGSDSRRLRFESAIK